MSPIDVELRNLTTEELLRYGFNLPRVSVLENELLHRCEQLLERLDESIDPEWIYDLLDAAEYLPSSRIE